MKPPRPPSSRLAFFQVFGGADPGLAQHPFELLDVCVCQGQVAPKALQCEVHVRGLVRLLEKRRRAFVYTDFTDELSEIEEVELREIRVGADFERFREKARAYLREHEGVVARREDRVIEAGSEPIRPVLLVICSSSSRRMKSRYVICSMTSSGFVMPPDQKASQIRSIFAFSSPVITASKRIEERGGRRDQRTIIDTKLSDGSALVVLPGRTMANSHLLARTANLVSEEVLWEDSRVLPLDLCLDVSSLSSLRSPRISTAM